MTESVANANDCQPGGSGAGSTVGPWPHSVLIDAAELDHLRATLEALQRENQELKRRIEGRVSRHEEIDRRRTAVAGIADALAQSRATEVELRAKVEQVKGMHTRERCLYPPDEWYCIECDRRFPCPTLAALDAEPPAARGETSQNAANRPLTGPSANGSAENDHSAMETAEESS